MNRIQDLREERGLSLQELSDSIKEVTGKKISKASLSNYEREDQQPKKDTWKTLANFFHVNLSYIMGLSPNRNPIDEHLYKQDISRLVELTNGDYPNAPEMRQILRTLSIILRDVKDKKEYLQAIYRFAYSLLVINPYPDNDNVTIDNSGKMLTHIESAKLIDSKRVDMEKTVNYFVSEALNGLSVNENHKLRHKAVSSEQSDDESSTAFLHIEKRMNEFENKMDALDDENFKKVDPSKGSD